MANTMLISLVENETRLENHGKMEHVALSEFDGGHARNAARRL